MVYVDFISPRIGSKINHLSIRDTSAHSMVFLFVSILLHSRASYPSSH
jgi:hypothetical protein